MAGKGRACWAVPPLADDCSGSPAGQSLALAAGGAPSIIDVRGEVPASADAAAATASEAAAAGSAVMDVTTDAAAAALPAKHERHCSSGSVGESSAAGAEAAKDTRVCSVCGDCAVGCNFNAITCGSCKAFFRRNANKGKPLKCMFSGKCSMNVSTRRFCTACRLRKCFSVGMKTELILDDVEKRLRKEKVLINREKKLQRLQDMQRAGCSNRHASDSCDSLASGSCQPPPTALSFRAPLLSPNCTSAGHTSGESQLASSSRSAGCSRCGPHAADEPVLPDSAIASTKATGFSCTHSEIPAEPAMCRTAASSAAAVTSGIEGSCLGSDLAPSCTTAIGQPIVQSSQSTTSSIGVPEDTDAAATTALVPVAAGRVSSTVGIFSSSSASSLPAVAGSIVSETDMQLLYTECFRMPTVHPRSAQRRLTPLEREEIVELERSYSSTLGQVNSHTWDELKPTGSIEHFINSTTSATRQLVSFAKSLLGFASAPQDVQVALLKAGAVACLTIRAAQEYDPDRQCWDDGQGKTMSIDVMGQAFAGVDRIAGRRHGALLGSIKRLVPTASNGRRDLAVFALLQAITMLSPEHALSACNDGGTLAVLSDAQQHYMLLLGRHLEAAYSYSLAADVLPSLLQHLAMCKRYGAHVRRWLSACNVSHIDPLLKEVYNLEPPARPAAEFADVPADPS